MPVNVGNNLTLKNTELSSTYGELFKKLNVAYGWTHTKTTSEGGTAIVLIGNGDIIDTMECNDINKCSGGHGIKYGYSYGSNAVIINGKIYVRTSSTIRQLGTKTDYVMVASASNDNNVYAIDSSGKLWILSNTNTETQIGEDTTWSMIGYIRDSNSNGIIGINNGKIYIVNTTGVTQKNTEITNAYKIAAIPDSSSPFGLCITSDGNLYRLNNNTQTLLGPDNIWESIYSFYSGSTEYVINSNKELYYILNTTLYKQNITNVKKVLGTNSFSVCITNDNKLYFGSSVASLYDNNYGRYYDISNNINWTDISSGTNYSNAAFYAIGDGKLYKIVCNTSNISATTYTQIGTSNNYQKVDGYCGGNTTAANITGIAWTGDATTVSHTILTTKTPQVSDDTYLDKDLTKYSTVQSTGIGTVTDEYRTYNRDVSKDTSFTAIPQATVHETVSTIDFLRITNPDIN